MALSFSLTGALSVALSGLKASSTAAQVISGNVSNAHTPGYTDKTLDLSTNSLGYVTVSGYTRATDSVLSATLNSATSSASYLSTMNGYMTQVQQVLDSSDSPPALAAAISNFQSAWTTLSASPESTTAQKGVVTAGEQLASTVDSIASQAAQLKTQVEGDLATNVNTLNSDLQQVQNLNAQISTTLSVGQSTGDLEDQRSTLVNAIAAMTNVQVMSRADGQIALYTPGGS